MGLSTLDWSLVGLYFVFSFGIAIYYARRASQGTTEFFGAGKNLPWWLAGTSMVATTFAADTPLAVTELVAQSGVAGNWLWWNMAFGNMLTVFFFASLWRRSGVLTDVELVEIRYSGRAAAWLRGIKAVFFGLLLNAVVIGWVSLAMETVLRVLFPDLTLFGQSSFSVLGAEVSAALVLVAGLVLVVALYALLAGLWGVAVTDVFQFVIAIVGCFFLAYYALDAPEVGGLAGLRERLPEATLQLLPNVGGGAADAAGAAGEVLSLSVLAFFAYVGVQWWASWYPGSEPGGGGYVAQRMLSAKDEKNAVFATLWFTIAHFCLRPWPWILVALASLLLYPELSAGEEREGFVLAMRDLLPSGLRGLLFASFLAAFMSTISTQLNWGTSYLVNDVWRRFIQPQASEKQLVRVSRWLTFAVAVVGLVVTANLDSISQAWGLILSASAGLGFVLILRWYWWRINAWSELAVTLSPIVLMTAALIAGAFDASIPGLSAAFPLNLFAVAGFSIALALVVTFATRPTDPARLDAFYRRTRPGGPGWKEVAARNPDIRPGDRLGPLFLNWLAGVILVYSVLFGVGYLLFGRTVAGVVCLLVAAGATAFLVHHFRRETELDYDERHARTSTLTP
jgi:Na+/proline symporter